MVDSSQLGLGCLPSPKDDRDIRFGLSIAELKPIDLSREFPPIRNQGSINSCTAFATTDLFWYIRKLQKLATWEPSQMFTYYGARVLGGFEKEDRGAYIRDALKSANKDGITRSELWEYNRDNLFNRPSESAWKNAENNQALQYQSLNNTKEELLGCLSEGYPFVFGAIIYESFIKSQTEFMVGPVPIPDTSTEKVVGGHALLAVGWYEHPGGSDNVFVIVRNSWGENVGLEGYHHIPLDFLLNSSLCYDFWTIRKVEVAPEDLPPAPAPVVEPKATNTEQDAPVSIWKKPFTYSLICSGVLILFALVKTLFR